MRSRSILAVLLATFLLIITFPVQIAAIDCSFYTWDCFDCGISTYCWDASYELQQFQYCGGYVYSMDCAYDGYCFQAGGDPTCTAERVTFWTVCGSDNEYYYYDRDICCQ